MFRQVEKIINLSLPEKILNLLYIDLSVPHFIYFNSDWETSHEEKCFFDLTEDDLPNIIDEFINGDESQIEIYTFEQFAVAFNNDMISDLGYILPVKFSKK